MKGIKRCFFLFLFSFGSSSLFGAAQFEIVWDSVFGGTDPDTPSAITRAEGGYLLGGSSASTNGTKTAPKLGNPDFWVIKIDEQGRKIWEQTYVHTYSATLSTMKAAGGGAYLLGGQSESGPWLVQINENGEVIWERLVTEADFANLYQIELASDGFFLTGEGRTVVKTDTLGRTVWSRQLDYGGRAALATPDGGALIGATAYVIGQPFGFGYYDYLATKLDPNGVEQWRKFYGGDGADFVSLLAADSAGYFYIGGQTHSRRSGNKTSGTIDGLPTRMWLVKTDSSGNKLWDVEFGEGAETVSTCLKVTADGGCLFGGNVSTLGPRGTVLLGFVLYKVGADGVHEWTFRDSSSDQLASIEFAPDGDIVLFGATGGDYLKRDYRARKLHVINGPPEMPVIYLDGQQRSVIYGATNHSVLEIKSALPGGPIHYTLDDSVPNAGSPVYTNPVILTNDATIRAAVLGEAPLFSAPVKLIVFNGYKLSVITNPAGQIVVSPDLPAHMPREGIDATAIPAPGWSFSQWEGYLAGRKDNPIAFTLMEDGAISASFVTPLLLEATNGTIHSSTNVANPVYGTKIRFTALPTNGYYFSGWSGSISGQDNPVTLDVLSPNPLVRAEFAPLPNQVSLVVDPYGEGEVIQSPRGNIFPRGQTISLQAKPNDGSSFLGWLVSTNTIETNEITLTLEESTVVRAIFSGTAKFSQSVEMAVPSAVRPGTRQILNPVASSGLPVRIVVVSGPALMENNELVVTNAGTITIRAEQPGNALYLPAMTERVLAAGAVSLRPVGSVALGPPGSPDLGWSGGSLRLALSGNYAYVTTRGASFGAFVIIDVSDPAQPRRAGSFQSTNSGSYYATTIAAAGEYVYLASSSLSIIQVSDPSAPTLVGSYVGTQGPIWNIAVYEDVLYLQDSSSLLVIDIHNPAEPRKLAEFANSSFGRIAVTGHYLYAPPAIFDIADPAKPIRSDSLSFHGSVSAISGDLLLNLQDSGAFQLFDISERLAPAPLGSFPLGFDRIGGVAILENYAFLATYLSYSSSEIRIVDISRPVEPVLAGVYSLPGATNGIATDGKYLYAVSGATGLHILEIDRPAPPPPVLGALSIRLLGDEIYEVFWPRSVTGFRLQESATLSSNVWEYLEAPMETEDEYRLVVKSSERLFFRLVREGSQSP